MSQRLFDSSFDRALQSAVTTVSGWVLPLPATSSAVLLVNVESGVERHRQIVAKRRLD